jgi:hypothetical protein
MKECRDCNNDREEALKEKYPLRSHCPQVAHITRPYSTNLQAHNVERTIQAPFSANAHPPASHSSPVSSPSRVSCDGQGSPGSSDTSDEDRDVDAYGLR